MNRTFSLMYIPDPLEKEGNEGETERKEGNMDIKRELRKKGKKEGRNEERMKDRKEKNGQVEGKVE